MDKKIGKKILWTHNFKNEPGAGGVWMFNQYEYLKDDVDLYYLDRLRNPFQFIKHFFALKKLSKNYDIIHAQYGSAVGFLTSYTKPIKILSLKGSDWYKAPNPSILHKIRILVGGILTKWSIKKFDHVIVMSNKMKNLVLQQHPDKQVETIVDPIDLKRFPEQKEFEKEKKFVKKILFASVNKNNPIKRFDLAKESFDILNIDFPNTEFVVMSNIAHDQVCDFMKGMDVLLLTSTHEGWPNVVKEMLALNKPFVSTDVSDLANIASQTKSCFVCNDDPIELSEALKKSLLAPKEDLRKFVLNFSMDNSISSYKRIYNKYL